MYRIFLYLLLIYNDSVENIHNDYIKNMIKLTNLYRRMHGLEELKVPESLKLASELQANTMCKEMKMTHKTPFPDRRTLRKRLEYFNFEGSNIGENIAKQQNDDFKEVFKVWSKSDLHKKNILGDYNYIGVSTCVGKDKNRYWVQVFGKGYVKWKGSKYNYENYLKENEENNFNLRNFQSFENNNQFELSNDGDNMIFLIKDTEDFNKIIKNLPKNIHLKYKGTYKKYAVVFNQNNFEDSNEMSTTRINQNPNEMSTTQINQNPNEMSTTKINIPNTTQINQNPNIPSTTQINQNPNEMSTTQINQNPNELITTQINQNPSTTQINKDPNIPSTTQINKDPNIPSTTQINQNPNLSKGLNPLYSQIHNIFEEIHLEKDDTHTRSISPNIIINKDESSKVEYVLKRILDKLDSFNENKSVMNHISQSTIKEGITSTTVNSSINNNSNTTVNPNINNNSNSTVNSSINNNSNTTVNPNINNNSNTTVNSSINNNSNTTVTSSIPSVNTLPIITTTVVKTVYNYEPSISLPENNLKTLTLSYKKKKNNSINDKNITVTVNLDESNDKYFNREINKNKKIKQYLTGFFKKNIKKENCEEENSLNEFLNSLVTDKKNDCEIIDIGDPFYQEI